MIGKQCDVENCRVFCDLVDDRERKIGLFT
jgi:hypothetical protein